MGRYTGKPMVRLLECFVLKSIGQLDDEQCSILKKMEPKLRNTYGLDGSWDEIINGVMGFPDTLPNKLTEIWVGYSNKAKQTGVSVVPNEFAMQFIDQNYPELFQGN